MSVIKKYGYIRAIIVGIPFGIACLIVGVGQFKDIPKSINELDKSEGIIESFGIKDIYDAEIETDLNVFFIKLKNDEYYTELGRNIEILKTHMPVKLKKTSKVTIWHKKNEKYIEQLLIDNELLIKYVPPYWIAHFFFWLGLVTTISGIVYVVKHPEDLTGKKRD
ncbi:MAG: hypothetical protein ACEPOZ_11515 [Marinifilaceae bacterium]